jgi:Zn-dependent protease with chaperone function
VTGLILLWAGLGAALVTFASNWLALIPWRRARELHWTERARLYHPVRIAATANLWVVPAVLSMGALLLWPEECPHWMSMVFVAAIGAVAGAIPMDREVFPRIAMRELLRQVAAGWLMRFLRWVVFLMAIALMPEHFNGRAAIVGMLVLVLCILWDRGGFIYFGQWLGLFIRPSERLERIVEDTGAKMNVLPDGLWTMRASFAQAFAKPATRTLIFTDRLLQVCSDEEIGTICAHELGHLSETRRQYYKRYVLWLMFLPWVFFKPMVNTFNLAGFMVLLLLTIMGPLIYRRVSRKLELRADRIAHANEPKEEAYARALLRLYEDGLLPAVHAREDATHPHLYDRLVAAGLTPGFPRPKAPGSMAWHGVLFSSLLGILATVMILRMSEGF